MLAILLANIFLYWPISSFHNSHSSNFYVFSVLSLICDKVSISRLSKAEKEAGFWCLNFPNLIFHIVKNTESIWNIKTVEFHLNWKQICHKRKKRKKDCPLILWAKIKHNAYHGGSRSTFQGQFGCVGLI